MKAALYYGIEDVRIEKIPNPECPPEGVVVRIEYAGICGTDVRNYYDGTHKLKPPVITGHEASGKVTQTGNKHNIHQEGDLVAITPVIYCGKCHYCKNNMHSLCQDLKEFGFQYPGTFQEYMAIPGEAFDRGMVLPVPEGLSSKHAAISEPPSSCLYAQEKAETGEGDCIAIFGAGPVGCIHIQVARLRGVSKIVMIDISSQRLKMAKPFGADEYIDNSTPDFEQAINEITGGIGFDKIIVTAPAAKAVEQSLEFVRKRGLIIIFAGLSRDNPYIRLDSNKIHYNDINIMGHFGQEKRHVKQSLELLRQKKMDAEKLITHVLDLKDIKKGFELIKQKKALKVLLKP
jgi:L-iditol 2-dehydrogenase